MTIPIIDIFAGPGGLGEGFSSLRDGNNNRVFRIHLSMEKEQNAHRTLQLRSFFRQFEDAPVPEDYYRFLRREIGLEHLYERHPREAAAAVREAVQITLGPDKWETTRRLIAQALGDAREWVLIGGPPCQAFSLVGRARNKGIEGYVAYKDRRHFLYREYLRILAKFRPSVFVMENVQGILSSKPEGTLLINSIKADLTDPITALAGELNSATVGSALHYRLHTLSPDGRGSFVIRAEQHGIPQARHRVIIVGIREDLGAVRPEALKTVPTVALGRILDGLPRLRSGLSRTKDSAELWINLLKKAGERRWLQTVRRNDSEIGEQLERALAHLSKPKADRGGEFLACEPRCGHESEWYLDQRIGGVCNHTTRGHIEKDLNRYLYAACYAMACNESPKLRDFPADLLPDHKNVSDAIENGGLFQDRFRVQLSDRPSTTITSHISKDGNYYIHYDPTQCRSLTVREAARAQTFPDNYFFTGNRTAQYVQVGNAVPPLLARQIAERVWQVLIQAGLQIHGHSGHCT